MTDIISVSLRFRMKVSNYQILLATTQINDQNGVGIYFTTPSTNRWFYLITNRFNSNWLYSITQNAPLYMFFELTSLSVSYFKSKHIENLLKEFPRYPPMD